MDVFDERGGRLLTLAGVAEARGVTLAAVTKARQRGSLPEPAGWLDARTPLWREADIVAPFPAELRALPRWVRRSDRKVPLQVSGEPASSTDPATWSTWERVRASRVGVGPGFVLNGDGIVCVDLDHCLDGDALEPWAEEVVGLAGDTFIERSPSGDGLHIWGFGRIGRGMRRGRIEAYGNGRYVAVTGNAFRRSPSKLGDLTQLIEHLTA